MKVVELIVEMRNICRNLRIGGHRIRCVPTMGALHSGHASLIECARQDKDLGQLDNNCDQSRIVIIVSIFTNPTQFNDPSDFLNYPKTLQADLNLCEKLNVDYVFVPKLSEMYPGTNSKEEFTRCTVLPPRDINNVLEGKSRAGHFSGVLTVVCKLFNIVIPHEAYFGEKDYQQFIMISRMVRDLNMDVNIIPVETARESDMLPYSSRNIRLDPTHRKAARIMYKVLEDAKQALEAEVGKKGDKKHDVNNIILASMLTTLSINLDTETSRLTKVDYLDLRCAEDFSEVCHDQNFNNFDCNKGCAKRRFLAAGDYTLITRLLISVIAGKTRLLDNIEVRLNLSYCLMI